MLPRFSFHKRAPAGRFPGLAFDRDKGWRNNWCPSSTGSGGLKPAAYLFQTLRVSAEVGVGQSMPSWNLLGITTKRLAEPAGCRRPQPPTAVKRERPRLSGNLSRNLILT